jgi:aminoglycoside phosphotransferase (APT) family kinase protein
VSALRERVARRITEVWPGGELTEFESLPGGHSGITCLGTFTLPDGERERVVIKATPPGRRPGGRHDVLRQARILSLVTSAGGGTVRVPEVLIVDDGLAGDSLADDGGEPYFVMRWHPGESVEPVLDPAGHLSPDIIGARAFSAIEVLAELHAVPTPDEPVLTPVQELERWIPTMRTLDADLREGSEALEAALLSSAPPPAGPAIVHGDFRLGNTLCTGGKVNVVIDWEIWSVGDPRMDMGWMVLFSDPRNFPGVGDAGCLMPPARSLWDAYEQATGASTERCEWFESLAGYKMAAIMGNNLARHRSGRYHDPFQEQLPPTIRCLIEGAASRLAST